MARKVASVIENNFAKGLITEATALQYPENSVVETFDCVYDVLGSVSRRLGFDYEYGYATKTIDKTNSVINTYLWKNVTGDGTISFVVVQIGALLYFYSSDQSSTSLSGGAQSATIDLSTFLVSGSTLSPRTLECQFSDGLGRMYVTNPCLEHFFVTYTGGSFVTTQYDLTIRDLEGVSDSNALTTRPGTLGANDNHRYNIYNQGWDATKVTTWNTSQSNFPSSADVWWVFKTTANVFDPTTQSSNTRGTTPAPKGRFLLSAYKGNRDLASGLSGISATTSGVARASSTAFFAGRAWYAGINAAGYNSKLYFSQIIAGDSQVGACYQQNDPTNEDLFALLPDDGGVISIPEAGTIYKLFAMQNTLLVFAYRGVWQITGSTGLGFTATDYVVAKLSNIRSISGTSFVDCNGAPMWWNTDGIWTVVGGQQGLQVQSITRSTIQSFYDDIPSTSKIVARGTFSPLDQIVHWVYNASSPTVLDEQYTYDSVLTLNLVTGAFYPWTISQPTSGPRVHGLVLIDGTGGQSQETTVVSDAAEDVVDDLGNIVVGYDLTNVAITPKVKFLTSVPNGATFNFTWSETNDTAHADWTTSGHSTDFESYFITGYKLYGKAQNVFQANYVFLYHEGTGDCYLQGVWDFATSTSTGKFTQRQLCQFDDSAYSNNHKRLKVRGQGRSLQFKVSSYNANPFNVIGWAVYGTSTDVA